MDLIRENDLTLTHSLIGRAAGTSPGTFNLSDDTALRVMREKLTPALSCVVHVSWQRLAHWQTRSGCIRHAWAG